jgi:hypothetical protein
MRVMLQAAGTWLFVAIVLAIGGIVLTSFVIDAGAEDLHAQTEVLRGARPEGSRIAIGAWLSARMAADIDPANIEALGSRADELDHRADRIRELAAAASVAGLVLALGTARPENRMARSQSASSGLAKTISNGTV